MSAALVSAIERLTDRIEQLEKAAKKPPRYSWRPREVAAITGLTYETVLAMIHDGRLGHVPGGRLHLVPDSEVRRFLKIDPAPDPH